MITNIFISNVLEGFYRSYQSLNQKDKIYWTTYDTLEANRALFYGADHKAIVTSSLINSKHFNQIGKLMNWQDTINLSPQNPSPFICQDIYSDSIIKEKIIQLIKENPKINLIPYRATPEFYDLVYFLKQKGLSFNTPETIPQEFQFINNYFHCKRGFRHLWTKAVNPDLFNVSIPQGFITGNRNEAIEAGFWFQQQKRSFVIKYNRGTQGIGLIINNHLQLPNNKKEFTANLTLLLKDKIWDEPSIIVEEWIDINHNILNGSPSIEFFIDQDGKVNPTYACEQVLAEDKKTFRGVYLHQQVIQHPSIRNAFKAGLLFGQALSQFGYRGYFDIDLVIDKKNHVYAVESNMRRTGGTHIHETAQSLLGNNYRQKYYILSEDLILSKSIKLDYDQCFQLFKDLLYNPQTRKGLIFANPDMLKVNIFNTLLIADSNQKIILIRKEIKKKLNQLNR